MERACKTQSAGGACFYVRSNESKMSVRNSGQNQTRKNEGGALRRPTTHGGAKDFSGGQSKCKARCSLIRPVIFDHVVGTISLT